MNNKKEINYQYLDEMEEIIEASTDGSWEISSPEGEERMQQAKYFDFIAMARNEMPRLIKQLRLYMKCNEELQSLDGMQQMAIEKLNKEVALLRESLRMLEQQHKLMLVQQAGL